MIYIAEELVKRRHIFFRVRKIQEINGKIKAIIL